MIREIIRFAPYISELTTSTGHGAPESIVPENEPENMRFNNMSLIIINPALSFFAISNTLSEDFPTNTSHSIWQPVQSSSLIIEWIIKKAFFQSLALAAFPLVTSVPGFNIEPSTCCHNLMYRLYARCSLGLIIPINLIGH